MIRWIRRIWLFIMQKWLIIPIIVLFFVAVALIIPSFSPLPTQDDAGQAWNKSWEMMGSVMGVEDPGMGFTLLNNDTALAGNDTFYASWVTGEASDYTNADGKHVDLYPAQIYLMLYGCYDESLAREAMADWMKRQEGIYSVRERREEAHAGQSFSLLLYDCGSDTNPYSRGISGYSIFGHYVILAELTCTDAFDGNEAEILQHFLDGCHYASSKLKPKS